MSNATAQEASVDAMRRYSDAGDVEGALVFFHAATAAPAALADNDVAWPRE